MSHKASPALQAMLTGETAAFVGAAITKTKMTATKLSNCGGVHFEQNV